MTTQRYDHAQPGKPGHTTPDRLLSTAPSRSAIIQTLRAAIDDLQLLQQTIQRMIEQEGPGHKERQELQQILKYAQDSEMQARRELGALMDKLED